MNKKKVLSILTAAGIMTTALSASVFAADVETRAIGEYTKLITGKTVVPYILQTEEDRVTGAEFKAKYPGADVADDAILVTGQEIKVGSNKYTVVIYGDVDKDGAVDLADAVTALNYYKGIDTNLDDAQKLAADVDQDKVIDLADAVSVLNVYKGITPFAEITTAPKAEDEKPVVSQGIEEFSITYDNIYDERTLNVKFKADPNGYQYTIQNVTDNKDIADSDVTIDRAGYTTSLTVSDAKMPEKNKDTEKTNQYKLVVKNSDGETVATQEFKLSSLFDSWVWLNWNDTKYSSIVTENMNSLSLIAEIGPAVDYDTNVKVTLSDNDGNKSEATAVLKAGNTQVVVSGFSGISKLKDGPIGASVEVKDKYGNVTKDDMAGFTDKYTSEYSIIDVTTDRANNQFTVKIKDKSTDGVGIKKIYYLVKEEANPSNVSVDAVVADHERTQAGPTVTLADDITLEDGTEYMVYVVVENDNGVKTGVASARFASDTDEQLATIDDADAASTSFGVFQWKRNTIDADADMIAALKEFKVTLLADGVAVDTATTTKNSIDLSSLIKKDMKDRTAAVDYTAEVTTVANSGKGYADSNAAVVTAGGVTQTFTVNPITVANTLSIADDENNHQILSFGNVVDSGNEYLKEYKVNVYKYTNSTDVSETVAATYTVSKNDTGVDLTDKLFNQLGSKDTGKYRVKVQAIALEDSVALNSEETIQKLDTYFVAAPTGLTATSKADDKIEVTVNSIPDILSGDVVTYTAYYRANLIKGKQADWSDATTLALTKNGTAYKATTPALTDKQEYEVKVVAKYNNVVVAETGVTTVTATKEETPIKLALLQVAEYNNQPVSASTGKIIYVSDDVFFANEKEYKKSDKKVNYTQIINVLKKLNATDQIQVVDEDEINVSLNNDKKTYTSTTEFENVDLTITGSNVTFSGKVKSIDVAGANANTKVNLEGAEIVGSSDIITLNNKVSEIKVKAGAKVQLSTAAVKINGVTVTANGAVVTATANGVSIDAKLAANPVEVSTKETKEVEFKNINNTTTIRVEETETSNVLTLKGELATGTTLNVIAGNVGTVDVSGLSADDSNIAVAGPDGKVITSKKIENLVISGKTFTVKPTEGNMTIEGNKISGIGTIEWTAPANTAVPAGIELEDTIGDAGLTVGGLRVERNINTANYKIKLTSANKVESVKITLEKKVDVPTVTLKIAGV